MGVLGRVAPALLVLLCSASCSQLSLPACSVRCSPTESCALGLVCGQDGYCHGDGKLVGCGSDGGSDGGTGCVGCVAPDAGPFNYAFVSSVAYVPGMLGGTSGADGYCTALALAAKLPGTFMAWLSTSTISAPMRFSTLSPPPSGWIRPDRRPFANSIADMASGTIFYPLRLDEAGNDLSTTATGDYPRVPVATGTAQDGTTADTAGDWTSTTASYTAGEALATTYFWTQAATINPADGPPPAHLYCLGVDHAASLTIVPTPGRVAFVSSGTVAASITAADTLCAMEANGMSGTFKAFMSSPTQSASARFDLSGATWVRLDGVPWLYQATDLSAGAFPTALNVTTGGSYNSFAEVWTGASSTTMLALLAGSCDGWTSTEKAQTAIAGWDVYSAVGAFDQDTDDCSSQEAVYCLQQ
jgi:hypothetical protein